MNVVGSRLAIFIGAPGECHVIYRARGVLPFPTHKPSSQMPRTGLSFI